MRKCNCSGNCAPQSASLTRREFLGFVGIGAGSLLAGGSAWAAFNLSTTERERWERSLFETATPRRYFSDKHLDARMHLGGIGTGNFEVGADGQLTTWQLFNTLRDGLVPFYFGVKAGQTAKLLQTAGGPDWPRVKRIEMTGEYPLATLRFEDDDLPVRLELAANTPFAPLDVKLSSLPIALFNFRIHNPTELTQVVSLAAMLTNPIGYDAIGKIEGESHPNFVGNVNEAFSEGQAGGLFMRAETGQPATLDQPLSIYALEPFKDLNLPPEDRPETLKVEILDPKKFTATILDNPEQTLIWLDELPEGTTGPLLASIRDCVRQGATVIFSGRTMPSSNAYATVTGGKPLAGTVGRPDILFEDFEHGYEKWTVEGQSFGQEPAHGALPGQQPVAGFLGKGLVNSFFLGDDSTGQLTSKPFTIDRHFIRFLVGGGHYPTTQIRLLVGDAIVRATSGADNERLTPAVWNVSEFAGRTAQIEIVDLQKGQWGHINADQIIFTDWPGDRLALEVLDELLPARFTAVKQVPSETGGLRSGVFDNEKLRPGAKEARAANGLRTLTCPAGKGLVALMAGQILDPSQARSSQARQRAYATLCDLTGRQYVEMRGQSTKAPGFGTLALATTGPKITGSTDAGDWTQAWEQFSKQGAFVPLESVKSNSPTASGRSVNGALATTISVPPAGTVEVPFFFGWHYPNSYYYETKEWIGCHYATQWADARAVVDHSITNYASLRKKTALFHDTFYDSTLPYWLLDCLTANAAILRHIGVVFRIANGDIYGWEGSNGCCDPTCTHVWGYEQSLARLFPDLEKEMRRIDFDHQQGADGGINNRTLVPSPPHPTGEHPFTDGHASCILKAYREALNSPDDSFFKRYWPKVQRAVEYLVARDAKTSGGTPAGILQDDQWNTYDEALHGVTTFISGYYLAALRAGEEWARRMDDAATADRFHAVFESGQKKLVELCWNGRYFQQSLPDYLKRRGEFGPGCMSDQLIGQWWAHQLGLGYILPKDLVVSSLRSIFKYNFKSDLTGWRHMPRAFAGANDKGLIICTWPDGGRPENVLLYSDEVWTGVEYQVAAHMIYEGLLEEGFSIVKGARDRYDGIPRPPIQRNPWSEIECGGHYTRAMSSWSLLLALSGYDYDGARQTLRFAPRYKPEDFKCFFSAPEGWGSLAQKSEGTAQRIEIAVKSGTLRITALEVSPRAGGTLPRVAATLGGKAVPASVASGNGRCQITFDDQSVPIAEGETLKLILT